MALDLVAGAILLALASSALAVLTPRRSAPAQAASTVLMLASMALALVGAGLRLLGGGDSAAILPWQAAGGSAIGLDPLSAFFLVPVFLVGGLGSAYALGYWPRASHPRDGRRVEAFWGLLVAGLGLLTIARHAMAFLLGWEAMALSAFFLVATEDRHAETRRASLVYLAATHVGTLVLFALFTLWRAATGSFDLAAAAAPMPAAVHALLFVLALLAFGIKAGLMPFHFWLPGAHACAPSHVSAMLSGVVLKMGVYALLRFFLIIGPIPSSWGPILLGLGSASALLGVAFAIGQHDLKRLLAYHSVENIGIIFMGLGLALLGRSAGNDRLLVLGLAGSLLHTWNHALFKPLLFLGAGSVVHETHTRDLEHLGGLATRMPKSAAAFLVGAIAICGLPPLNGFVSELLVYVGLFGSVGEGGALGAAALAAPVLAATGALALACFVKAYGAAFLGLPRSEAAARAREVPLSMRVPMWTLAAACLAIGVAPALSAPVLDLVIAQWRGSGGVALPALATLLPLGTVGVLSSALALVVLILVVLAALARAGRKRVAEGRRAAPPPRAEVGTWDCGYASPTARMQYTASSFGRSIVALLGWALRPKTGIRPVEGAFPKGSSIETRVDDSVLDGLLKPSFRALERLSIWARRFQQGLAQDYILYILIMLMILLATQVPFGELAGKLLGP